MYGRILLAICAIWLWAGTVNARDIDVNALTNIGFEGTRDALRFSFEAEQPLAATDISAKVDGAVLIFRFEGTKVARKWLKFEDAGIVRTLLHPSRKDAPAAVLRVRTTHKKVPRVLLSNIRVQPTDGGLVVSVPRTTAIAKRWASAPEVVAEAEAAPAAVETPTEAAPVEAAAAADAPEAEAAPAAGEDQPLFAEEAPAAAEEEAQTVAHTAPREGGPGTEIVVLSLLLLGGTGFFLFRKMKGQKLDGSGKAVIRPIGAHMLGPKQGLLLVEVAGERVLLGTGDKGVQMLAKINGEGAEAIGRADDVAAAAGAEPTEIADQMPNFAAALQKAQAEAEAREAAAPAPTPVPVTPTARTIPGARASELTAAANPQTDSADAYDEGADEAASIASRVESVIARVRAVTTGKGDAANDGFADDPVATDDVERDFFARADEVAREAAEEDALELLADRMESEDTVAIGGRTSRKAPPPLPARARKKSAERRAAARKQAKAAEASVTRLTPPAEDPAANDLLAKIRRLQGA